MSRINHGEAAIQLGCVCLDGQCIMTKAMLSTASGASQKTVARSLKRLGFVVDTVTTLKANGGRALRVTVPKILRGDVTTPVTTPVTTCIRKEV